MIGLLGQKNLVIIGPLKRTLISQIGLPGITELTLTRFTWMYITILTALTVRKELPLTGLFERASL